MYEKNRKHNATVLSESQAKHLHCFYLPFFAKAYVTSGTSVSPHFHN